MPKGHMIAFKLSMGLGSRPSLEDAGKGEA